MQPVINAPEIATAREQQLFNGKNFHVFIYNKTESISGLHQHIGKRSRNLYGFPALYLHALTVYTDEHIILVTVSILEQPNFYKVVITFTLT